MIGSWRKNRGFTLIELVAVIVIMGVLTTIAIRQLAPVSESIKIEQTREEMDRLAKAIVGNPDLENKGTRSDFGYVGDVGALPPNLDALISNPGYATWKGPYISNELEQMPDDFKKDAWQEAYDYAGGIEITSTGSGEIISRRLAGSTTQLLDNTVSGNLYDLDGTPPGNIYRDSVAVRLIIPDGSGNIATRSISVDAGGYFEFGSVPIGNHDLQLIYNPNADTLRRFVSVRPRSRVYSEYYLASNVWQADTVAAGLEYITDSDTLATANCFKLMFWVINNTGNPISISSLTLSWPSPPAYYKTITWNGIVVRSNNPALSSGDIAVFTGPQTINDGQSVRIEVEQFHSNPGGGGTPVDMSGTTFSIIFSDGSSVTVLADLCF